ncbi:MAG: outer membrane protein transport protein [Burkholderiales bacterium]
MSRTLKQHTARVAAALATLSLGFAVGSAHAAGFFLPYQGAAAIGNSLAGSAALGEDASTVFFNPAGMSRIESAQIAIAGHYVQPDFNFTNGGSSGTVGLLATGGNGGDFAPGVGIPNLYAVMPAGPWRFGLGVSAPWGSKTDYDPTWVGRFQAGLTDLKTINVNPSVSYRLGNQLSVGLGLNYMQLEAEIQRAQLLPGPSVGTARFEGKDHGYGYNVGVLWEPSLATRVGVSYRSKVDMMLEGQQTVLTSGGAVVTSQSFDINAAITMPAIAQVSAVHAINDRVSLLGDLSYYQWSAIQSLDVRNRSTGALSTSLALKYRDTKRISAGLNYRLNDAWMLRGGVAWDQAPVGSAEDRTANQPDADRTWISVGARWDIARNHRLDLAYAHVFFAGNPINHTVATSTTTTMTLRGSYDNSADILSLQYTFGW